ncbi:MAG: GEVED domain-containing protein, partial [Pirellulaceae bacterium]
LTNNGTNVTVTYELDDDGITVPGNRVINFNSNTSASQLAATIAISVRNSDLGLNPLSSADGVVTLGGTTHSLDMANTNLLEIGLSGVPAAQPVFFTPGETYTVGVPVKEPIFEDREMAVAIRDAINGAVAESLLVEVTASVRIEDGQVATNEVLVEGASDVAGGTSAVFRSNIGDVAGNPLKPNRSDGTTRFNVFVGSGLDFGDAPFPYPTLADDDGARHEIVGEFFLGEVVDVDLDGQPSFLSDGDDLDGQDDEDGVIIPATLVGGFGASITVTASADGFIDAWIDYNQDGDWDDAEEQIFQRKAVSAGVNILPLTVTGTAAEGPAYARFRYSSAGGLAPTGYAEDGEVEDYRVNIVGNPWRNAGNHLNVSGDTTVSGVQLVSPVDALLIINLLNRFSSRDLSLPFKTTLVNSIAATDTTLQVDPADVGLLPKNTPYELNIGRERLQVTGAAGNVLNVLRGFSNTTATVHGAGDTTSILPLPPRAPYYDVNGDINVTPLDALLVINFLSERNSGDGGEGEAPLTSQYVAAGSDLRDDPSSAAEAAMYASSYAAIVDHRLSATTVDVASGADDTDDTHDDLMTAISWFARTTPADDRGLTSLIDELATTVRSEASTHDLLFAELDELTGI